MSSVDTGFNDGSNAVFAFVNCDTGTNPIDLGLERLLGNVVVNQHHRRFTQGARGLRPSVGHAR